ncbi:MAG: T9SS type A sorting domain-containing protein [Bacteroidales bacterium]|nr:T9SS type A sorting domain-containing protein [Bacteroidales bacterium]
MKRKKIDISAIMFRENMLNKLTKRFLFVLSFVVLLPAIGHGQELSFKWAEKLSCTGKINPSELYIDSLKNVLVSGNFSDSLFISQDTLLSPNAFNGFIAVFDSLGQYKWAKNIESNKFSVITNIIEVPGGYLVSGVFQENLLPGTMVGVDTIFHNGYAENVLLKINDIGEPEWIKPVGLNSYGNRTFFKKINNDSFLFAGSFNKAFCLDDTISFGGRKGLFGITIAIDGSIETPFLFGTEDEVVLSDAQFDSQHHLWLTGYYKGIIEIGDSLIWDSEKASNGFLFQLDTNYLIIQSLRFESFMDNYPQKLTSAYPGNMFVSGEFAGTMVIGNDTIRAAWKKDIFMAEFNPLGTLVKIRNIGGRAIKQCGGMVKNDFNDFLISGSFRGRMELDSLCLIESTPANFDIFLAKYDESFNLKRLHKFNGAHSDVAYNLLTDNSGYYYYFGSFNESFAFDQEVSLEGKGSDLVISRFFDCDYKRKLEMTTTDTSFCGNGILVAPEGFTSYEWSNGIDQMSAAIDSSGLYYLTVIDEYGCESKDSVLVEINPLPVILLPDTVFMCDNASIWLDACTTALGFLWNTGADSSRIEVNTPGDYSVAVTGFNGCVNDKNVIVANYETPEILLDDYYLLDEDDLVVLDPGVYFNYQWSNGWNGQNLLLDGMAIVSGVYDWQLNVTSFDGCGLSKVFQVERVEGKNASGNGNSQSANSNALNSIMDNPDTEISDTIDKQVLGNDQIVDIEGLINSRELFIWPNPCKDNFNYRFNINDIGVFKEGGNFWLMITDAKGKLITQRNVVTGNEETFNGSVEVFDLQPGLYFVIIKGKNTLLYNSLIIQ